MFGQVWPQCPPTIRERPPSGHDRCAMQLTDFKVLTFDCYGTLIDWETGILHALRRCVAKAGGARCRATRCWRHFARHEAAQEQTTPAMPYSQLLADVYQRLARGVGRRGDARGGNRFGASVPDWPAFPDSPAALQYLKRHYRLVILSNVDREFVPLQQRAAAVEFDADLHRAGHRLLQARPAQFRIPARPAARGLRHRRRRISCTRRRACSTTTRRRSASASARRGSTAATPTQAGARPCRRRARRRSIFASKAWPRWWTRTLPSRTADPGTDAECEPLHSDDAQAAGLCRDS